MVVLSDETRATVKATIPVLEEHGLQIARNFYSKLFSTFPVTCVFFNKDKVDTKTGVPPQVAALGGAVIAYAQHIDDVTPIMPVVERICHKHVSRNVRGPHYNLVGACLLEAISDTLGPEVATEKVIIAWGAAFKFLADAFIATETALRKEAKVVAGYVGYKKFNITGVKKHGDGAKTLFIASSDGSPVPPHRGGQFISFELMDVPDLGMAKTSAWLSDVSEKYMAFTLFPDAAGECDRPNSFMLERKIGDTLRVSVPCGRFKIDDSVVSTMKDVTVAVKENECVGMAAAVAKSLIAAGAENVTLLVPCGEYVLDKSLAVEVYEGSLTVEQLASPTTKGIFVTSDLADLAKSAPPSCTDDVGNTRHAYVAIID